ncbi:alpha-isopropylmalate synthase regulatory domain-containing protein [Coprobacillaceae bacterium CR2/5/TPMF4]|nr:alpha-isopropylmalate synthase regulatory domain-containing protein [Coprobacillaceae bacterium CR2/5/TPMF4]
MEQYVDIEEPYRFVKQRLIDISDEDSVYERRAEITIEVNGEIKELTGLGNGPIDAVKNALNSLPGQYSHLLDYSEHALTSGSSSKAAAYVYLRAKEALSKNMG